MKSISVLKLSFIVLFVITSTTLLAQSHDYKPSCRYSKSNVTAIDGTCPACKKDRDDEKKAIQEEAQREKERIAQEAVKKAENIRKSAEELARKQEEARKEREKNVVYIGAPKVPKTSESKTNQKGVINLKISGYKGKLYPVSIYKNNQRGVALTDKQGDTILVTTEYGTKRDENYNVEGMPNNVAIISYNYTVPSFYPNVSFYPQNLINSKGEKLLKSDNINSIQYCSNNFFIISKGGSTSENRMDHGVSISLYDYSKNTFYEIKNPKSPSKSYINDYGIDMKDHFGISQIWKKEDYPINERRIGGLIPEYTELLKRTDWLLVFDMIVDNNYGTSRGITRKIFYVDNDRNLKEFGVFTESQ